MSVIVICLSKETFAILFHSLVQSVESLPIEESACPRVVPELDWASLWAEYRILPELHAVKFLLR